MSSGNCWRTVRSWIGVILLWLLVCQLVVLPRSATAQDTPRATAQDTPRATAQDAPPGKAAVMGNGKGAVTRSSASATAFTCSRNLNRDNSYLDKVQAAYAKVEGLRARFSQESFLSSLSLSEQSAGEVLYKRPGMMRWNYIFPESQTFLVRGQEFWFVQPVDKQVTIDKFEKILLTDAPVAFLLGLGDLAKSFKLISVCATGSGILLKLEEKQSKKLKGFSLLVSDSTWLPLGAEVVDVTDNKNRIVFSDLTTNSDVGSSEFEFTPPDDFDVQDRRILREEPPEALADGVEAF